MRTTLLKLIYALVFVLAATPALSAGNPPPDSKKLEQDMQHLPWKQFRSVIEAIPKLKADVDAYGSFGWQYVQANYKTHKWKKNIDRLDDDQKQQLANLVQAAKRTK